MAKNDETAVNRECETESEVETKADAEPEVKFHVPNLFYFPGNPVGSPSNSDRLLTLSNLQLAVLSSSVLFDNIQYQYSIQEHEGEMCLVFTCECGCQIAMGMGLAITVVHNYIDGAANSNGREAENREISSIIKEMFAELMKPSQDMKPTKAPRRFNFN